MLYELFMEIIGKLKNDEIKILIEDLKEYVENDELF